MTFLLYATPALAGAPKNNGLVRLKSDYSVDVTAKRLASSIQAKGLKLFTEIDHAAGAQSVGQSLPPTRLLVFGNPKVGTPLMQCGRTVAIDLPQKALVWEDDAGQVWVEYNNPQYLQARHNLKDCGPVVKKIDSALRTLVTSATQTDLKSER
ncbi:DUF302 domain-containing protein [Acaryochloris marina]|uniref:DUF302 domain-containing protein n=1 Tax=Acaryochloris marina TaxID=155978 RepID=UPI0021C49330|nr:DUF302 domain-containing protein [Acaryochloris marina]BDM83378.1 hypothetical protein AM10699_62390 [Acaryochloris marina MBIC10699]